MLFFYLLSFLIGLLTIFFSYWICLLLLLVLLFTYLRKGFKHVLVAGFIFAIGVVIALLILLHNTEQYLNTYGIVIKSSQNYVLLITLKGKYYLSSKNNEFNLLDIIKFEGKTIELSFFVAFSIFENIKNGFCSSLTQQKKYWQSQFF